MKVTKLDRLKQLSEKYSKYAFVCWKGVCTTTGTGFDTYSGFMAKAGEVFVFLANASALVAVGVLVYGAYTFIMSAGDDQKIDMGTKLITNAIIGLVVVFISRLIMDYVIQKVLGL